MYIYTERDKYTYVHIHTERVRGRCECTVCTTIMCHIRTVNNEHKLEAEIRTQTMF